MSDNFVRYVNYWSAYVAVDRSDDNGTDHHDPVRKGNIYLTVEGSARIRRLDLWEVGRVHKLYEQLKSASDECL